MNNSKDWRQSDAYLIKVFRGTTDLRGFVEHVRTGEKHRFQGLQGLGVAIARMRVRRERDGETRRNDAET